MPSIPGCIKTERSALNILRPPCDLPHPITNKPSNKNNQKDTKYYLFKYLLRIYRAHSGTMQIEHKPLAHSSSSSRALAQEMLLRDLAGDKENTAEKSKNIKDQNKGMTISKLLEVECHNEDEDSGRLSLPTAPWDVADESFIIGNKDSSEDNEEPIYDLPQRLVDRPESRIHINDLDRCSIAIVKAHNERSTHRLSRAQGDMYYRDRFLGVPRWRKRFVSIVDHAYFGPVMFLFKYNAKSGIVEINSKIMIALENSKSELGPNTKGKDGLYKCEFTITTEMKKKYRFYVKNSLQRDYWVQEIRTHIGKK